MQAKQQIV